METQVAAPQVIPSSPPVPTGRPPGLIPRPRWKRAIDWFWCGPAISRASAALAHEPEARRAQRLRAQAANDLARRATDAGSSGGPSSADPIACELYRQSIYWSLLALSSERGQDTTTPTFAALLAEPQARALLAERGPSSQGDAALLPLASEDVVDVVERTPEEQSRLLFARREQAERLLARLEQPQQALNALWLRRLVRLGTVVFALALLAIGLLTLGDLREQSQDLAQGKAWRASSSSISSCVSPQQYCDETPGFFFHTSEERDPWLEIDLEAPRDFSAVHVLNRRDCCTDRATPLVVEVSNDRLRWKPVAKREGTFRSWKASFAKERARYVRVRAVGYKLLHLAGVRVLP